MEMAIKTKMHIRAIYVQRTLKEEYWLSMLDTSVLLNNLIGKPICQQEIHPDKPLMLTLGFGQKNPVSYTISGYRGEWELGVYDAPWRITMADNIILSCSLNYENQADILKELQLGTFAGFKSTDKYISIALDNSICIDFFPLYDDEMFFIFLPEKHYIQYTYNRGWEYGKSNKPWRPKPLDKSILPMARI